MGTGHDAMRRARGPEADLRSPNHRTALQPWRRRSGSRTAAPLVPRSPRRVGAGLVLGLLGSLMAVGLGLTYRLNKVMNFAQGDLGTAPAVLAVGLVGFSGVDYFVGLATGLVAAVLLTATVEFVVVRRFRRSPRLILTVATIGLSQFLVVVSLLIPRIWGQAPIATAVVNFPWHVTWHIAPIVFDADDLVAVIVSVACLAAVSIWFTRSDIGIAVQAAGDRRDRASMLGIPVGRLQTVTWVVAGVLSFVSIFFQAAILGLPLDPTFGLTALVTALAALALGNFTELPAIAASAVALGILEQGVAWDDPTNPALGLAVLAGVVFAAIVVRQLVARRTDREAEATLALAGSVRDLPDAPATSPRSGSGTRSRTGRLRRRLHAAALDGPGRAHPHLGPRRAGHRRLLGRRADRLVGPGQLGPDVLCRRRRGRRCRGAARLALGPEPGAAARRRRRRGGRGRRRYPDAAARRDVRRRDDAGLRPGRLGLPARPGRVLLDPAGPLGMPYLFGNSLTSQSSVFELCLGVLVLVLVAMHGLRHSRTGRVLRALPTNQRAASGYGVSVMGRSSTRSPSPVSSPGSPAASSSWSTSSTRRRRSSCR